MRDVMVGMEVCGERRRTSWREEVFTVKRIGKVVSVDMVVGLDVVFSGLGSEDGWGWGVYLNARTCKYSCRTSSSDQQTVSSFLVLRSGEWHWPRGLSAGVISPPLDVRLQLSINRRRLIRPQRLYH